MKKLLTATALSAALANPLAASGYVEPVLEPQVIVEDTSSSAGGILVPLLALVMFALAINAGDGQTVAISDARLKTDITPVGTAANGLTLYEYRYVGSPTVHRGVMAQEVLTHTPEAVVTLPGGYLAVNYTMLGIEPAIVAP
ncbi:tail fiber domain-containing protein [Nioella aestuarii]|uniref:tail fiber domain-containing protein n=1 Tax=Nioella aestuarii TaxID=1662864 RepID=UPI003D7F7853